MNTASVSFSARTARKRQVLGIAWTDTDDAAPGDPRPDPCPTYYPTCVRKTSVYLPEQLKAQLSALASRTRRSEAELVRAAIEHVVAEGAPAAAATADPPVPGRLVGVGVGPGAADLLTVRALRALHRATRVVAPCTDVGAMGRAEAIVREAAPDVAVERLVFAMTAGTGGALRPRSSTRRRGSRSLLDQGEEVAFITLGDPNLYSTFSSITGAARVRSGRDRSLPLCRASWPSKSSQRARAQCSPTTNSRSSCCPPATKPRARPEVPSPPRCRTTPRCRHLQGRTPRRGRRRPACATRDGWRARCSANCSGCPANAIAPVADVADRPASYLSALIVPARVAAVISFVGAGPGAPDLLTLRGADRLRNAEIVVWASSLVPEAVLAHCRDGVVLHDSAVMTLEDVIDVYAAADAEAAIVRLHSGDPSVYGAIAEQLDWCRATGRSFEVVPGVMSMSAAAAALQRELTVPQLSQSVVLTRLAGRTEASMRPGEGVAALRGRAGLDGSVPVGRPT